ncbi:uncharacterized protein UTRI_02666_B [Ustilago trichophora]|uniref:Uncharacterized protein n=1 Tax=Ustilago trichophora TaxID=86804 RepID=A0A5C3E544_9BASI|nr:uncharacterized protein UTRI_02666_B [Ustilago trichophora]
MQSLPSSSAPGSGSTRRAELTGRRRTIYANRSPSDKPPSPSRVVVAEGSEFVLEPLPDRGSSSTSRLSSATRHVSAPYSSASSSSQLQSSPQYRAVSTSITPPRTRHADRPYRPPPSSSARFYERQQQLWMLQQPSLLSPTPAAYPASSLAHSQAYSCSARSSSLYQPVTASGSQLAQPASSPYSYATNSEHAPASIRSRSSSLASATSRSRATSVSSLAQPGTQHTGNRSRAGSDAGSFTRSRISNGYHSHTDDDSLDNDPYQSFSAMSPGLPTTQAQVNGAGTKSSLAQQQSAPRSDRHTLHYAPQDTKKQQRSASEDTLGDSVDADWDAELGISEADHTEPLRLPILQQQDHVLHPSLSITGDASTLKPDIVSSKLVVSAVASPVQTESHLQNIQAADLKGIRVTSSVRESWDDDFLFQNEEDPIDSTPQSSVAAQQFGSSERNGSTSASSSKSLHLLGNHDKDDEDDVENWDDAFSWNADPLLTPSASTTSSLHNSMRLPSAPCHAQGHAAHGNRTSSRELPPDVRRHLDFGGGGEPPKSKKRFSNASTASDATDFSARLAAQSDVDSYLPRMSQDSDDLSATSLRSSNQRNALGLVSSGRKDRHDLNGRSDESGDDTETETPSKEAVAAIKSRPARRSLGAALGFDTSRKSIAKDSAASAQSPSRVGGQKKDAADDSGAKTHARSQSKSKLGALQRLSLSRSRISVANASNSSVNEMPETGDNSQRLYADNVNRSQASLLSQMSTSSNRSKRGVSPSSLEKSYAALRSTSFRRLLGRGEKTTVAPSNGVNSLATPPSSPPRRRSDLPQPPDIMCSPPRERSSAHASHQPMSPPSAWLGLRRSSEATPTRPRDESGRRGSDSFQRDSPSQVSWAVPGSPSKPPASLGDAIRWNDASFLSGQSRVDGPSRLDGKSSSNEVESRYGGLGHPPTAGLRRDFSSSNTLRGDLSYGAEAVPTPVRSGRDASGAGPAARQLQAAQREGHARVRSDEASADGPTAPYPYLGEKMDRGSTSRSVSASTAHSHTSAESLYGYRMRKQISVSSGPDAHDSETSYGTSVGSSPGLSNQSSSGWLSYGKRGGTPSMDTKDTAWTASVDLSGRHNPLSVQEDHSRLNNMTGSPLYLEKTLDGAPAVVLRPARKQSVPGSLAPSRYAASNGGDLSVVDSPIRPSPGTASRSTETNLAKQMSSTADTSVPILPSTSQTTSSAASPLKSATRRNSLSDLKIPSRISKAQTGIRNNISLVRDFAKGIEELKTLKASYMDQRIKAPLHTSDVEERVQNWLECADVLIGLGEGRSESDSAAQVDTVSHTPLATRVDNRRTTFSDASSYALPRSPLEGPTSRQSSISGARSASGTSQSTTSTTDGVRSVDVQREIDILSAILGGARLTPVSRAQSRSHGRFQSETYTRDELPHRNTDYASVPSKAIAPTSSGETSVAWSNLTTPVRDSFDEKRSDGATSRSRHSERPFHTAPVISGANTPLGDVVPPLDGVDVGDANRSAKRRLRSASRAGLQGLRELLKVFKGAAGDDSVASSKACGTTEADMSKDDPNDENRPSLDAGPSTPQTSKQKRKSLNLKRRSFLRSKSSLESMHIKSPDVPSTQAATPPMPTAPENGRYALSSSKADRRKQVPSPSKSSLDVTWEAGSSAECSREAKETKAARRISLQSAMRDKRRSVDLVPPSKAPADSRFKDTSSQQVRRPSLAVRPQPPVNTSVTPDPRRASTTVDSLHRGAAPLRSHSSLETPMVQKLALRPEAMPGLLIYVQATKQHLQMAIDELGPPISQ